MIRLNCVVEGQTEQGFINDIICPHLANLGIYCYTRCVQTSRKRGRKFSGGLLSYKQLKGDLQRWMREDQNAETYFTTMIDLYALPNDFPGYGQALRLPDPFQAVADLEQAFKIEIVEILSWI